MGSQVYSHRLGTISDEQLTKATARHGLGAFVNAQPIHSGLFGQNLFLTTTTGDYVLRGAPHWVNGVRHDQWQFRKEMFFARCVHEGCDVPVPWPQHYDEGDDLFGWPYLIMPRMPGICFNDRTIMKALEPSDQLGVAEALGECLARLHRVKWPQTGEVDESCEFSPYPKGFLHHVASEVLIFSAAAEKNGAIHAADRDLIDRTIAAALAKPLSSSQGTYVHADFKLDNLVVQKVAERWQVSGLFDFHTACFGDGVMDLFRQGCAYWDREPALAQAFIKSWRSHAHKPNLDRARFGLYLMNERMKMWEFFSRPGAPNFGPLAATFGEYFQRYESVLWEFAAD